MKSSRHRQRRRSRWSEWIGVMSGTSLDGVDVVLASFRGEEGDFEWKIESHLALAFEPELRSRLFAVAEGEEVTASEFAALHQSLGEVYAAAVLELLGSEGRDPGSIGGIGISGQTVFHQSGRGGRAGAVTLQLGSGAIVASRVGAPVVSDFRTADIAEGGEGAPLVPFADYLLFGDPEEGRIVLNIGGIANLTAIPAAAKAEDVVAFDTGPGNMVSDGLVWVLSEGKASFDSDGKKASQGEIIKPLLEAAIGHPFFVQPPPRSAGREQFGERFVTAWINEAKTSELSECDLLATAVALTAESIARAVRQYVLPRMEIQTVYVAGGGAKNPAMLQALADRLEEVEIETSFSLGLAPECREALAFAVLARETLHGRPSNLPQVTGAKRRVVLGQISGERDFA